MTQQTESHKKTFTAAADLAVYRRVKFDGSSPAQVVYADQTDSDGYVGITQEAASSGNSVTIALKGQLGTRKAVASEALAVNATLYAADSGKVSDTAYGNRIATALEAATADGDIIEILEDYGSASQVDGATTSIEAADSNGAIPILFEKVMAAAATAGTIVTALPYAVKIVNCHIISRDETAANFTLYRNATAMSATVAKGTTLDGVVNIGTLVAAHDQLTAGQALKFTLSAVAQVDIYATAIRV